MDALVAKVAAIAAGVDYHYDVGTVWRWRVPADGAQAFPSIGLFDLSEAVVYRAPPCVHRTLTVTVQGIHTAMADQEPDTVARNLMADIQTALTSDLRLGGLTIDITETANRLAVDAPTEPYVVVEVDILIKYRTRLGDPAANN